MEEVIYYNELYDIYKNLLTDKQRKYFEDYYFSNLSYREIAQNCNVSCNAVYNQVNITRKVLDSYEEKLRFKEKLEKIEKLFNDEKIITEIREIILEC